MFEIWQQAIRENLSNVANNIGSDLVIVVTGNQLDQEFWKKSFQLKSRDIFRNDGKTAIIVTTEAIKKGNFLGTLNAWKISRAERQQRNLDLPPVTLMTMVFGSGTRLSPFTQAVGGRKPAFPLPRKASISNTYFNGADLSALFSNRWLEHLKDCGFRGVVVKWGDESIIPSNPWISQPDKFSDVDAVRFVWKTQITESLAREKEWVVIDSKTDLMKYQLARHNIATLQKRVEQFNSSSYELGVNLGSLAISYDCLDIATEIFGNDIANDRLLADWDPYVWIALSCSTEEQWKDEIKYEQSIGKSGILELEKHYPDFFSKVTLFRTTLEKKKGRPIKVGVLDFGDAFWTDIGQHLSLRNCFQSLTQDTERGKATCELFGIDRQPDIHGNIIVNSKLPEGMEIRNSVIIDSIISDPDSVVIDGVIIGSRHTKVSMPSGGISFQSAVKNLVFTGPNVMLFRALGEDYTIGEGGRLTTLLVDGKKINLATNEQIVDYSGPNYTEPFMGNPVSFKEAGLLMSSAYDNEFEERWYQLLREVNF